MKVINYNKVVEYVVLTEDNQFNLSTKVETYIKNDWQPFGGVSCNLDSTYGYTYAQAMVKYEVTGV